jgi:hypothetical protein
MGERDRTITAVLGTADCGGCRKLRTKKRPARGWPFLLVLEEQHLGRLTLKTCNR